MPVAQSEDHVRDIPDLALGNRPAVRNWFSVLIARAASCEAEECSVGVHWRDGDAGTEDVGPRLATCVVGEHDEGPCLVTDGFIAVSPPRNIETQVVACQYPARHDDVPEWTVHKLI